MEDVVKHEVLQGTQEEDKVVRLYVRPDAEVSISEKSSVATIAGSSASALKIPVEKAPWYDHKLPWFDKRPWWSVPTRPWFDDPKLPGFEGTGPKDILQENTLAGQAGDPRQWPGGRQPTDRKAGGAFCYGYPTHRATVENNRVAGIWAFWRSSDHSSCRHTNQDKPVAGHRDPAGQFLFLERDTAKCRSLMQWQGIWQRAQTRRHIFSFKQAVERLLPIWQAL